MVKTLLRADLFTCDSDAFQDGIGFGASAKDQINYTEVRYKVIAKHLAITYALVRKYTLCTIFCFYNISQVCNG